MNTNIKSKTFEAFTLEHLAEKEDSVNNYLHFFRKNLPSKNKLTWEDLYKFSAYYFDNPNFNQRERAFKKVRADYYDLLQNTANPNELPSVNSRSDLLSWVCKKHNESLTKEGLSEVNCNLDSLLSKYGPNEKYVNKYFGTDFKLKY